MQERLMRFDPASGDAAPYPSHAKQYRDWHGTVAWLFNPWTGTKRDPRDIGGDPWGLMIEPEAAPEMIKHVKEATWGVAGGQPLRTDRPKAPTYTVEQRGDNTFHVWRGVDRETVEKMLLAEIAAKPESVWDETPPAPPPHIHVRPFPKVEKLPEVLHARHQTEDLYKVTYPDESLRANIPEGALAPDEGIRPDYEAKKAAHEAAKVEKEMADIGARMSGQDMTSDERAVVSSELARLTEQLKAEAAAVARDMLDRQDIPLDGRKLAPVDLEAPHFAETQEAVRHAAESVIKKWHLSEQAGLTFAQEPKYCIRHGQLANRATNEPIPTDEPVFILRARDKQAAAAIKYYANNVRDPAHRAAVYKRFSDFCKFAEAYPERMKYADTQPNEVPVDYVVTPTLNVVEKEGGNG